MLADTLQVGQIFRVGKLPQKLRHYVVVNKFKTTIHIVCIEKDPMKIEIHRIQHFEIYTHKEYHFYVLSLSDTYSVINDVIDHKINSIAEYWSVSRSKKEQSPRNEIRKQNKLEYLKRKILNNLYQVDHSFFIENDK